MSAAEFIGACWLPDNGDQTVGDRANEIPLSAPEPSRLRDKTKTLAKVTDPNLQPSFVGAAHVSAHVTRRCLPPLRVNPTHDTIVGTRTTLN
jgi:hypothetical protein